MIDQINFECNFATLTPCFRIFKSTALLYGINGALDFLLSQ